MSDHTIEFREADHTYWRNGIHVPNVTTVIEPLTEYWRIPPTILAAAQERGLAAHKATEYFDLGTLDEATVDARIEPYLRGWKRFLQESGWVSQQIEVLLYHDGYGYAGRADRVGVLNGELTVIDIKTPKILEKVIGMQMAAYHAAANRMRKNSGLEPISKAFAVRLTDAGNYMVEAYDDKTDLSTFLACLQIWKWRVKHGKDHQHQLG